MSVSEHLLEKARLLSPLKRVVVKIGSATLSGRKEINRDRLRSLVHEIAELHARGLEVVIVTSGAVAAGLARLGRIERPKTIPQRQAAAAIGQIDLMALYEEYFGEVNVTVAQVLLTHDDLANRLRYINAKHTIETLLQARAVPIANENDTVATEELNFGDNDNLSALVATLVEADLLVILSDVAGLYAQDPRAHPQAPLVPLLHADADSGEFSVGPSAGPLGTGGMAAKLAAARKASAAGIPTFIADGRHVGVLPALFDPQQQVGTLLVPSRDRLTSRKHWIAYTLHAAGAIVVDDGAYQALREQGRSLLPSGVHEVQGTFAPGDCVRCVRRDGREFARGLVNYGSVDLQRIKGLHSNRIEEVLGYKIKDEVIHRDDLALLETC